MNKLAIAEAMIAHYNAQDADAYVALMSDDAVEAGYRGAVLRDGKEGVRSGLKAMFAVLLQVSNKRLRNNFGCLFSAAAARSAKVGSGLTTFYVLLPAGTDATDKRPPKQTG